MGETSGQAGARPEPGGATRMEEVPAVPRPGDYYERVPDPDEETDDEVAAAAAAEEDEGEGPEEDGVPIGEIVLVLKVDGDEVEFIHLRDEYTCDLAVFLRDYRFAPDGAERRDEQIRQARADLRRMLRAGHEMERRVDLGTPLAGDLSQPLLGGAVEPTPDGGPEVGAIPVVYEQGAPGALIPARDQMAAHVEQNKLMVAEVRNAAQRFAGQVAAAKDRLEALLYEQEAMFGALERLQDLARRAEQIIAVLNVYLGTDEEIVLIRDGKPAPPDAKISVRQLVLFADEEAAMFAEEGGLDFQKLSAFDRWVQEPEHLQQVLPEERGIVAFKPRRKKMDYGNSAANAYLNRENKKTYILVRNGQRLYRIASTVEADEYLFPTEKEFEDLFTTEEHDSETGERRTVRLRPGTHEFARAMEKADAKARTSGCFALLIQGLIDRTDVFRPFAFDSINVLDRRRHEEFIRYVRDAEKTLPTGRPSFREWQLGMNERLDVGQRVIGFFEMYGVGLEREQEGPRRGECDRLWPRRAAFPANLQLYTLERKSEDGGGFVFLYGRAEKVYPRDDYAREPKVRASCTVYPRDRFIIAFDQVAEEDITFYMSDRVNRHEYTSLFPLLRTVRELKRREREEEAPFRELLVGEIMRQHGASAEDARAALDELVSWWKLKNFVHRALLGEDRKALAMIVREYGLRLRRGRERERLRAKHLRVAEAIRAGQPEAVYVGHKSGNVYVALVAENDENVFVREQEWQADPASGTAALRDERRWKVVDSRRGRWEQVWVGGRWETWAVDVRASRYLTDPEREELLKGIWEDAREAAEPIGGYGRGGKKGRHCFLPLALVIRADQQFEAHYVEKKGRVPTAAEEAAGANSEAPVSSYRVYEWKRGVGGRPRRLRGGSFNGGYAVYESMKGERLPTDDELPWISQAAEEVTTPCGRAVRGKVLWSDPAAAERLAGEWRRHLEAQGREKARDSLVWKAGVRVEAEMLRRLKLAERERYDRDHGAPEFWEQHLKSLRLPQQHAGDFRKAVGVLGRRHVAIEGRTVGEIVEAAEAAGFKVGQKEREKLPTDFVVRIEAEGGEGGED